MPMSSYKTQTNSLTFTWSPFWRKSLPSVPPPAWSLTRGCPPVNSPPARAPSHPRSCCRCGRRCRWARRCRWRCCRRRRSGRCRRSRRHSSDRSRHRRRRSSGRSRPHYRRCRCRGRPVRSIIPRHVPMHVYLDRKGVPLPAQLPWSPVSTRTVSHGRTDALALHPRSRRLRRRRRRRRRRRCCCCCCCGRRCSGPPSLHHTSPLHPHAPPA